MVPPEDTARSAANSAGGPPKRGRFCRVRYPDPPYHSNESLLQDIAEALKPLLRDERACRELVGLAIKVVARAYLPNPVGTDRQVTRYAHEDLPDRSDLQLWLESILSGALLICDRRADPWMEERHVACREALRQRRKGHHDHNH